MSHSVEPKRSKRKANSNISDTTVTIKAATAEPTAVTTTIATTLATAQEAPLDLSKTIYNCYECIHKWAKEVKESDIQSGHTNRSNRSNRLISCSSRDNEVSYTCSDLSVKIRTNTIR